MSRTWLLLAARHKAQQLIVSCSHRRGIRQGVILSCREGWLGWGADRVRPVSVKPGGLGHPNCQGRSANRLEGRAAKVCPHPPPAVLLLGCLCLQESRRPALLLLGCSCQLADQTPAVLLLAGCCCWCPGVYPTQSVVCVKWALLRRLAAAAAPPRQGH